MSMQRGTPFAWNFQRAGGQSAYEAAQNALNQKRAADYVSNMEDRQVGNAQDMMNWMQSGNDAAQYQADQAAAAQAQEAQKAEQIKAIESQIAEIQARIAQNQAKLKNFTGSANQIAALEAQKINSQDPTMIWRWQKQREDTAKANDRALGNAGKNWKNTESMYLDQMMSSSNAGLEQQIRQFENAIREGKNYGQDTSELEKRKMKYEQILASGGPQGVRAKDDFDKAAADPNADTEALLGMIPSLPRDKQADAIKRIFDLKEKRAKKAEENKKKYDAQVRSRAIKLAGGEKKWKRLSPAYQQTLLDQAKMPGVK